MEKNQIIDSTMSMSYIEYISYITPLIISDLSERGWYEDAKNKVIVRYIANIKWKELNE